MKLLKIFTLISLFLFGISFSCSKEPEIWNLYFNLTGFNVTAYEDVNTYTTIGDGISGNKLDSCDTVKYNNLMISLWGSTELISYTQKEKKEYSFFENKIYAAKNSLPPNEIITGNVDSIIIYSNNNYTSENFAGGNLNDIFKLQYSNQKGFYSEKFYINDYIKEHPACTKNYLLYITNPPDSIMTHTFTIKYKKIDGTFIEVHTVPVVITP